MIKIISAVFVLLFMFNVSFGGKKALIWDDTDTMGTGHTQNENYFFYTKDISQRDGSYVLNITYGLNDLGDLAVNVPFGYMRIVETTYTDFADPSIEYKHRFYDNGNLKFALKPVVAIPVKPDSPHSEGRVSYGLTLITQYNSPDQRYKFFANTQYTVHRDRPFGNYELFQSVSAEYYFTQNLSVISTFYVVSYENLRSGFLVGVGYTGNRFEIGVGIGRNFSSQNDYSFYGGLTFRLF